MDKKIIKVLSQNNLYDEKENINIHNCNKLEDFFKKYHLNESKKHFFPDNITRDEKGRIILDNIPFITSNVDLKSKNKKMHNDCLWIILNNGARVLLKEIKDNNYIENELLIMYFLKSLNMSCANYDVVTLNGKTYLASLSFLAYDEKIIYPFSEPKNIRTTYEECKKYDGDLRFLKTCVADFSYGNPDRERNFGIITGGKVNNRNKQDRICPLFDNGEYSLCEYDLYQFPYVDDALEDSKEKIINYLLSFEGVMHWLKGPFRKATLEACVKRLEKEKGIILSNETYSGFEKYFKDSQTIINDELKNKGESFKIKLV